MQKHGVTELLVFELFNFYLATTQLACGTDALVRAMARTYCPPKYIFHFYISNLTDTERYLQPLN